MTSVLSSSEELIQHMTSALSLPHMPVSSFSPSPVDSKKSQQLILYCFMNSLYNSTCCRSSIFCRRCLIFIITFFLLHKYWFIKFMFFSFIWISVIWILNIFCLFKFVLIIFFRSFFISSWFCSTVSSHNLRNAAEVVLPPSSLPPHVTPLSRDLLTSEFTSNLSDPSAALVAHRLNSLSSIFEAESVRHEDFQQHPLLRNHLDSPISGTYRNLTSFVFGVYGTFIYLSWFYLTYLDPLFGFYL